MTEEQANLRFQIMLTNQAEEYASGGNFSINRDSHIPHFILVYWFTSIKLLQINIEFKIKPELFSSTTKLLKIELKVTDVK